MAYETIEAPMGAFIGWGVTPTQHVTGKVLDYSEDGGTDYNNRICPLLEVELSKPAASFNKELERTDISAGETVLITCGLKHLERTVRDANPKRGDLIILTLKELRATSNGKMKIFTIQVDRATAAAVSNGSAGFPADDSDSEPPF